MGEDGRHIHDRDQIITHLILEEVIPVAACRVKLNRDDYYQNLYSSKVSVDPPTIIVDTDDDIPPVGTDEVAKALKEMKRGKANQAMMKYLWISLKTVEILSWINWPSYSHFVLKNSNTR